LKRGYCDYIYHDCATKAELEFYLNKWKNKTINEKYPILYLAFHGEKGCVILTQKDKYSLEELSAFLGNKCAGKIIYFGSCSTLNIDKRIINNFLENTGALAAIGYKTDIDWIQSTACDLFVFEALQNEKLDTQGINKIHNKIISEYGNLHKILDNFLSTSSGDCECPLFMRNPVFIALFLVSLLNRQQLLHSLPY